MIDKSWWRNAPSFETSLPSSWISSFLLCDLGQATSPLWASFPICKMRMMGAQTSSSSCEDEIISFYVMCLQQWPAHGNFLHVRSACMLSRVWTVVHQAPLSMGFSRQEYRSGLPFPSPGIFPTQDSNLGLLHCRQVLYSLSHQRNPRSQKLCGKKTR